MKHPRNFGSLPHVRYRPELTTCPHCGAPLAFSHPVWAKPVQFLTGVEHLTNLGFRCSNPTCPFPRTVYRSAQAEARQIKDSGYGLEVVVHIGVLRFGEHRTREEIWRELHDGKALQISERHIQNLLEVYLALLRASEQDLARRLEPIAREHGGLILSLDGLQPERGNDQLWIIREVLSGTVLRAANLVEASASALEELLQPIKQVGVPVRGVISDAQGSIRLAVGAVFPDVPHQVCQFHALREAARPLFEADRHLAVEAKKELRAVRDVEVRVRQKGELDGTDDVVLDTVAALTQVVQEHGVLPCEFAGLRIMDDLTALGETVQHCLAKKGTSGLPGC